MPAAAAVTLLHRLARRPALFGAKPALSALKVLEGSTVKSCAIVRLSGVPCGVVTVELLCTCNELAVSNTTEASPQLVSVLDFFTTTLFNTLAAAHGDIPAVLHGQIEQYRQDFRPQRCLLPGAVAAVIHHDFADRRRRLELGDFFGAAAAGRQGINGTRRRIRAVPTVAPDRR